MDMVVVANRRLDQAGVVLWAALMLGGCVSRGRAAEHDHGAEQLAQMLADRPAMSLRLTPGDELSTWAVRHFDGDELGFPVYWNPDPPVEGYEADHRIPNGADTACVRIRSMDGATSDALSERYWRCFAYEICNLRNAADYLALCKEAFAGNVERAQWIRRATMLEFRAIERLRQFHVQVWRPWSAKMGVKDTPSLWFVGAGDTYEEWIGRYSRPGDYPNAFWGRYYDDNVVPYLAATQSAPLPR